MDLEEKKISYFVEGIEGELWKEYMRGARKIAKVTGGRAKG